jgi:hypothetical protein
MWTLIFPHHAGRTPTHGYEATREAAMAAFAKSWRQCGLFLRVFSESGADPSPPQREGVRGVGAARARASLSSGEIYGCLEFGSSTC